MKKLDLSSIVKIVKMHEGYGVFYNGLSYDIWINNKNPYYQRVSSRLIDYSNYVESSIATVRYSTVSDRLIFKENVQDILEEIRSYLEKIAKEIERKVEIPLTYIKN